MKHTQTNKKQPSGTVAIINLIGIAAIALSLVTGTAVVAINELKKLNTGDVFDQTYYAAEAGIHEGLYQVRRSPEARSLQIDVNGVPVNISIAIDTVNHDYRLITARASNPTGNIRTIQMMVDTKTYGGQFEFAIINGAGNIYLKGGSRIIGDVHSNSDILPATGGIPGTIEGSTWVAGTHKIQNTKILGNVYAYQLENDIITGNAYFTTADAATSITGTSNNLNPLPPERDLPISDDDVTRWKQDITATLMPNPAQCPGGAPANSYCITANTTLGWKKIQGNLYIDINAEVTLTGNVWVTGNIFLNNIGIMRLDPSYGAMSGVIVADGNIDINNNYQVYGSGTDGSYILFVSMSNSTNETTPAINSSNNSEAIVFATLHGLLKAVNNSSLHAAASYSLLLENNALVEYNPLLGSFIVREKEVQQVVPIINSWREL